MNYSYTERYSDPICIVDNGFNILYSNKGASDLFPAGQSNDGTLNLNVVFSGLAMSPKEIAGCQESPHVYSQSDGSEYTLHCYCTGENPERYEVLMKPARDRCELSVQLINSLMENREQGYFFMMLDEPVDWKGADDRESLMEWVMDHHRITRINEGFAAQYEADIDEMVGLTARQFFTHDPEGGKKVWTEFFDKGYLHTETSEKTLKGRDIWVEGYYYCMHDDEGRITGHFGIQHDITQRVKDREQFEENILTLHRERALFRSMLNSVPDYVFFKDLEGNYLGGNNAFSQHVGTEPYRLKGKNDLDFYTRYKAQKFLKSDKKVLTTGTTVKSKDLISNPDGSKILLETIKNPIKDEAGNILGIIGVGRDISRHDRVTRSLKAITRIQESIISAGDFDEGILKSFRIIMENFRVDRIYIFRNDQKKRIKSASQLYELTSQSASMQINNPELQKASYEDLGLSRWLHELRQNRLIKGAVRDLPEEERAILEMQDIKSVLVAPLFVSGYFYGFLGFDDVQQEREWDSVDVFNIRTLAVTFANTLERNDYFRLLKSKNQELLKINKELDSFVYSTSHDLRAPIASLLGLIEIMELEEDSNAKISEYLQIQKSQINKLDSFIRDILIYSRNSRLKPAIKEVNLENLICELVADYEHNEFRKKAAIHIETRGERIVHIDPFRIKVVLNNLLSNALKFTSHLESPLIEISCAVKDNKIDIEVRDNGPGIPREQADKVFNMFYRASEKKSGTGLGLYITRESVSKMKGTIKVHHNGRQGAVFALSLPNNVPKSHAKV